ncbi:hypothetical protein Lser_V15G37422 [Lactuca serriola]
MFWVLWFGEKFLYTWPDDVDDEMLTTRATSSIISTAQLKIIEYDNGIINVKTTPFVLKNASDKDTYSDSVDWKYLGNSHM